jgi:hypothetical protein
MMIVPSPPRPSTCQPRNTWMQTGPLNPFQRHDNFSLLVVSIQVFFLLRIYLGVGAL